MTVSVTARRIPLDLRVAYPGKLGPAIPPPPAGFVPYGTGFQAINEALETVSWDGNAWVSP